MAIYSLNLKSIGRTTHAAGTAGAHVLYIARPDAKAELVAAHMPTDPNAARAYLNRGELADRKNARVVDKVRIALPRELTPEQRMQLVQDFANDLTGGRVPWFAGIHAQGEDAHNPHCHLVIRDRDIETGKRVLRLSDSPRDRAKAGLEPKAVDWVRALWERHANRALEEAGHDARIDRRTLEAQGIDREPTIHIGPQAMEIDGKVKRPDSKIKETGNGRMIDYPQIDEGRTRKERHAEIVDLNIEKAARSQDFRVRVTAKVQREQMQLDRQLENTLIAEARSRTQEARQMRRDYAQELRGVRHDYRDKRDALRASQKEQWQAQRSTLTQQHQAERQALAEDHNRFKARFMRVVDVTGRTRKRQEEERRQLRDRHATERQEMVASYREQKTVQQEKLDKRYDQARSDLRTAYEPKMDAMRDDHVKVMIEADRQRQMRAAEREQAERVCEERIKRAEQLARSQLVKGPRRNIGPTLG